VNGHFTRQELVDVTTTEAIAERFVKWGKWFLIPATILLTLLGLILGVVGIRDVSSVHKAAQEAITESNKATKNAVDAQAKAQEAEDKVVVAINAISEATKKMGAQLNAAQALSDNVSGLEKKTASQITDAGKHVEGRLTELDNKVEEANKRIAEQQLKLTSTNELVTAMFSMGQVEHFPTAQGDTSTLVIVPLPAVQGQAQKGALVFMLLRGAPIFQTVQINARIFVQPKSSYFVQANILRFFWGDPAENLKQYPLEVSYVPDLTYHGPTYKALSVKNGHVFADETQIQ